MEESDLRKCHRTLGIFLSVFVILQAGSGLLITLRNIPVPHSHAHENSAHQSSSPVVDSHESKQLRLPESYAHEHASGEAQSHEQEGSVWNKYLEDIHHGGGFLGTFYRLLVGVGLPI